MNFFSIRRYHKLKSIIRVRKLGGNPEENSVKKPKEKYLKKLKNNELAELKLQFTS